MPIRVLVVDDNLGVLTGVSGALLDEGFEVFTAQSGSKALAQVDHIQPDLVLLDVILPPGDSGEGFGYYSGVPLLHRLREEYGITIPVIVFSVVDPVKVEEDLALLNVADYVRKPALPSELDKAICTVLGVQCDSGAST